MKGTWSSPTRARGQRPPTADIGLPRRRTRGALHPGRPGAGEPGGLDGHGRYGISMAGGLYADNGAIPDQDLVGFLEGPGSLEQTVSGLIAGTRTT